MFVLNVFSMHSDELEITNVPNLYLYIHINTHFA